MPLKEQSVLDLYCFIKAVWYLVRVTMVIVDTFKLCFYFSQAKHRNIFSSPGLCPWRAYVFTQSVASALASALAQCLSFQRCV